MIYFGLSDSHDVANRIHKESVDFEPLREAAFGAKRVPLKALEALCSPEVLSMVLCGCESQCLTQKGMLTPLRNRRSKFFREMYRVTAHYLELQERRLKLFGLPLVYTEWAELFPGRAEWANLSRNTHTHTHKTWKDTHQEIFLRIPVLTSLHHTTQARFCLERRRLFPSFPQAL
jgi:hypothetical protein